MLNRNKSYPRILTWLVNLLLNSFLFSQLMMFSPVKKEVWPISWNNVVHDLYTYHASNAIYDAIRHLQTHCQCTYIKALWYELFYAPSSKHFLHGSVRNLVSGNEAVVGDVWQELPSYAIWSCIISLVYKVSNSLDANDRYISCLVQRSYIHF